ncbi:hypothetical protein [Streptomyces sp. GSL17-111]|uniref:hypothetical protein n=1 Tax=Streptomyces sp. GSL17-111 TaxID=3121596 RepID=UPI0030F3F070
MMKKLLCVVLLLVSLVGCTRESSDDAEVDIRALCHGIFDARVIAHIEERGTFNPEKIEELTNGAVQLPGEFCSIRRTDDETLKFTMSYVWANVGDEYVPPGQRRSDVDGYVYGAGEDIQIIAGGRPDPSVSKIRFLCQVDESSELRTVEGKLVEHLFALNLEITFSVLLASAERAAEGFGCRNALDFPDAADIEGPAPTASATPEG